MLKQSQQTLPSVVQVAPFLPADVRRHAQALEGANLLRMLVTTYAYKPNGWLERVVRTADQLLQKDWSKRLRQRELAGVQHGHIARRTGSEFLRVWQRERNGTQKDKIAPVDA